MLEKICSAMCLASTLLLRVTPHSCSGQDISFCLHSNQSLKYASSPQEERNFIYGMNSRSHREGPCLVHPRNVVRYQRSTKAYLRIYTQHWSHILFNTVKMHCLLHSILLPRFAKILGYSVMVLSWLVGYIFFVLIILTLLLQHNEIFKCSLCNKLNFP